MSDVHAMSVLACPYCRGSLDVDQMGWQCTACGRARARVLGFLDFIPEGPGNLLPVAAQGHFDLQADIERAQALAVESLPSYEAMFERWLVLSESAAPARRGTRRFAKRYARVEAEAGDRHGQAIIDKAEAHLLSRGLPALRGEWALEAGGGVGKFLPGFGARFPFVAFVDCSVANLVLARQLVTEHGLENVLLVRADVTALPFRAGAFDFIHQNGVIEHVHDPVAMLREGLRVRSPGGVYLCLSPNRFPATPEPHFRLPLYGIFPQPVRGWLIALTRGKTSEAGTDLRSLRTLRRLFRAAGVHEPAVFFLPPRLLSIARRTPLRRMIKWALEWPPTRATSNWLLNSLLLPVMPYHLVVVASPDVDGND